VAGFLAVIGVPIARSPWLHFCGKWQTPDLMDQWYHDTKHKPMMKAAHDRWFGACYIRKWRLPAEGEEISGPVFCEIAIASDVAAPAEKIEALLDQIDQEIAAHDPRSFETMTGEYERQPYQLVGPLQEFPQVAPVRYLLLTHWKSADDAQRCGCDHRWRPRSRTWARFRRRSWCSSRIGLANAKACVRMDRTANSVCRLTRSRQSRRQRSSMVQTLRVLRLAAPEQQHQQAR